MLIALKSKDEWRIGRVHRKISFMPPKRETITAILISLVVSLLPLVPYALADHILAPEDIFSGFLMNPLDGFSYLAKMRQGAEGQWLFHLPYAHEPGEGSLIFIYYLFLGHIVRWTQIQPIYVYHLARVFFSFVMFVVAYFFLFRMLPSPRSRWWAFAFILVGSGLGWLGIPFGFLAMDLWVPESIPFLTAFSNAHFPLATALLLLLVLIHLRTNRRSWLNAIFALVFSFILAAIQPFAILILIVVLGVWIVWEGWMSWRKGGTTLSKENIRHPVWSFLAMLIGAAPWLIYDYWLTIHHPQLAVWNHQNQTPSPPLHECLFGFGLILIFSLIGTFKGKRYQDRTGRMLIAWVLFGSILIYAPLGIQRRFSLALFFPMVILAVSGIENLALSRRDFRRLLAIVLILSLPSNLFVLASGLTAVAKGDPAIVLQKEEREAYDWLSENTQSGELILAGMPSGNRIPAFTDLRVLYGHPFETPYAEQQEERVKDFYSTTKPIDSTIDALKTLGVVYVFYGPNEKVIGQAIWLEGLPKIFEAGDFAIYRIPEP